MDDFLMTDFDENWEGDEFALEDEMNNADPFDGFTRGEQDLFFRILDMLPREYLEAAMDYFMARPVKMRALIDYVKQKKEIIKNNDTEALDELFQRENIMMEELKRQADEIEAAMYGGGEQTSTREPDEYDEPVEENDLSQL